ncbi:hypothetical protein AMELA_G00098960 [Ameiurus melas]|uniref:Uncharacterized protein n=1 Tax=Ameiurus melas TaxID=219545 RepID=A0A7J6AUC2_AMEME|nr:hypothetical protein AMELA_G00098960 [Ameiurus melas]
MEEEEEEEEDGTRFLRITAGRWACLIDKATPVGKQATRIYLQIGIIASNAADLELVPPILDLALGCKDIHNCGIWA